MSFEALSWAWAQQLKQGPKLVLLALADYADDDGVCWPGFDALSEKTSMSRSSVVESIKALEQAGLIVIEKRADARGYRASNRYQLNISNVRNPDSGTKVQNPDAGETKVRNSNVGNPDSGSRSQAKSIASANVRNPDSGKSKVRNSESKVRNPDPNLQREPKNSSPNGDSLRERASALDLSALPADLSPAVWQDWLKHRKAKRSPITTQTVVNQIAAELGKAVAAGWTADDALAEAMAAGWTGVKAEWLKNRTAAMPTKPQAATRRGNFHEIDYEAEARAAGFSEVI